MLYIKCHINRIGRVIILIALLSVYNHWGQVAAQDLISENDEWFKYDDYYRIPKPNPNIVRCVYSTKRGNEELNAKLSFSVDYPRGESEFDMLTRDRISQGIYHFLGAFSDTKSSLFYMPGESAYTMLDYYGVSFLNKINEVIPVYATDTLGFENTIEIARIAESDDYVTYKEFYYHDNPFYSAMAHPSGQEYYITYSKTRFETLSEDDIFKESCITRVKELLVSRLALAFSERREERYEIADVLQTVAELQNTERIVNANINGEEFRIPELSIKDFPIESIALLSNGVLFYYPKYAISYGYEGEYTIILNYDDLHDYLKPSILSSISGFYDSFSDTSEEDDDTCAKAIHYIERGDYDSAESLLSESISTCNNTHFLEREKSLLAVIQSDRGEHSSAIASYKSLLSSKSIEELLSSYWTESFLWAIHLCRYGDRSQGEWLLKKIRTETPIRPMVIEDYMGHALSASVEFSNDIDEKLQFADLAYKIDTSILGNTVINRLNYLNKKFRIYFNSDKVGLDLKPAISVSEEMLDLLTNNLSEVYPYNLYGLSQLQVQTHEIWDLQQKRSMVYALMDDYISAISCLRDGFNQLLGKSEFEDLYYYDYLSKLYLRAGQTDRASQIADTCYTKLVDYTKRAASSLSLDERNSLYDFASDWLLESLPYVEIKANSRDCAGSLFSAAMVGKNLKVHIERELSDLLIASNDKGIIQDYINLRSILEQIDEAIYEDQPLSIINSLKKQYYDAEKALSEKSQVYGNYVETFNVSYSDILGRLSKTEAAIEFINYKDGDKEYYYALVLSQKLKQPKLISLFQLTDTSYGKALNISESYEMVWKPILKACKGIKRFYFSPSGVLTISPIENSQELPAKCDFIRLSSCRELLSLGNSRISSKHAALFGGLNYDYNLGSSKQETEKSIPLSDNNADFIGRGGRRFLAGSLDEVNNIQETLSKYGYGVDLYTGDRGTESSFKELSGTDFQILHIATHGFYFPKNDVNKRDNSLYVRKVDETINYDDGDLSRSGLLMSGANGVLNGHAASNPFDDGILSAVEISRLDFSGLDLVVLSACESGLGEMNKDGVAGLQRGFKKAGVQSLLISLWEVDDFATSLLMREFYSKTVEGMTKREALKAAQKYVRDYDNGKFSDYKYWAAFILLD